MEKIQYLMQIKSNINIAKETFLMEIYFDHADQIRPGQFVNIKIPGFSLRRPISVSSVEDGYFTIIYKTFGNGTKELSSFEAGEMIDVLGPLGRAFDIDESKEEILIIGGGVGVPPLYEVAKIYRKLDKKVNVVLGFNDKESVFLEEEFKNLGCQVYIACMDGTYGFKGNVVDLIKYEGLTGFVYSCGPDRMLDAVETNFTEGYISKESRMACGIGTCMACVCKDKKDPNKYYRICKEGPVFEIGVVQ